MLKQAQSEAALEIEMEILMRDREVAFAGYGCVYSGCLSYVLLER